MKESAKLYYRGILLFVTFLSLSLTTFAWFTSTSRTNVVMKSLEADKGIDSFQFFSYNGNHFSAEDQQFKGYTTPLESNRFEECFTEVSTSQVLNFRSLYPKVKFTFAIKATMNRVVDTDVAFVLREFEATSHAQKRKVDIAATADNITSAEPIYLSEAIDIFAEQWSSSSALSLEATLQQFLTQTETYTDVFQQTSQTLPEGKSLLFQQVNIKKQDVQPFYFFFTIQMSNQPETFYEYFADCLLNSITYACYKPSMTGNSNVYQGLSFLLRNMVLRIL